MGSRLRMRYRIDGQDRVTGVSHGWNAFAAENGGDALQSSQVVGQSLWGFIAGETTIHLYQAMLTRLRRGGPPMRFRFRCDAPERRRLLAMEITSHAAGQILFDVTSVREQSRTYVSLLDPNAPRTERLLCMCAWCKRVVLPDERWVEVEEAVDVLGLFSEGTPVPSLTHEICPACSNAIDGVLENPDLGAGGTVTFGMLT